MLSAKPVREDIEMSYPVQQRQNGALLADRRSDRIHGAVEIVGLAGEEYDVVGAVQLALLNRLYRTADFAAVLCLDDEAIASQLGFAPRPHQERYVGAALDEHAAEEASQRARTQHQVSHLIPQLCLRIRAYPSVPEPGFSALAPKETFRRLIPLCMLPGAGHGMPSTKTQQKGRAC